MVFCTHLIRGSRNYGILFFNKFYLNLKKQQRESQLFHATEFFRAVDSARERFQPPDRLSSLNNESGKKFFFRETVWAFDATCWPLQLTRVQVIPLRATRK